MKKIILGLICFVYSSCAVTTTMIGDVTAYTQNGEVLQKWERVVLQETVSSSFTGNYTSNNAFKTFGVNFYDKTSGKYIILGNAVPCIIEYTTEGPYNSQDTNYTSESKEQISSKQSNKEQYKQDLINQWRRLSVQEQALKSLMKGRDKSGIDYQNLKNKHKGIAMQMDYVSNKLWNLYGYDILARENSQIDKK